MPKTVVVNKTEALSPGYSQSIFIKQNNSSDFGGTNKDNGEANLISGNSNGGTGRLKYGSPEKSGNSSGIGIDDFGKKVIEGEFGAIQGLSFLKMLKPDYPILARKLGKEGKVLLRLFIDELGKVANVEVIEKAGYGFDEAAIEAMKASTFMPAKVDGKATACKALVPVKFTLKKES